MFIYLVTLYSYFQLTNGNTWSSSVCTFGKIPAECSEPCRFCCCLEEQDCQCVCDCCLCASDCRCEHCYFDLTEIEKPFDRDENSASEESMEQNDESVIVIDDEDNKRGNKILTCNNTILFGLFLAGGLMY